MKKISWEEAVLWLRDQPDKQDLVMACYYDDPLLAACERFFLSDEWQETVNFLPIPSGKALDLGAGRGISSYALAKQGWKVTALEPNPSEIVGAEAIRKLVGETKLPISVTETWGEKLPFDDESFDLVYGRQVLHHASDLQLFCTEASRVLCSGGILIATREHVISKMEDLPIFLENHPLDFLYGGENAFLIEQYKEAIINAGLSIQTILGLYDSPINYFPLSHDDWLSVCFYPISKLLGKKFGILIEMVPYFGPRIVKHFAHQKTIHDQTPGRMYTFICQKP